MKQDIQIRWLIRRDMREVLEIERQCFAHPWGDEEFLCCLRQRNCIGMAVEAGHDVIGFMIYELHKSRLHVLKLAVHPGHQRSGVGVAMVQRLVDKLSQQRRNEIVIEVRESNLDGQLFFRAHGFRAMSILPVYFEDTGEDAYMMRYRLVADSVTSPFAPTNRISGLGII